MSDGHLHRVVVKSKLEAVELWRDWPDEVRLEYGG